MSSPLFYANFDAEIEMARASTPGPHPKLPAPIRTRLQRRAPEWLAALRPSGAGELDVETDVDADREPPSAMLAWAETSSVAALREHWQLAGPELGEHWIDRLWATVPDPETTARCNDRRFWLGLGWLLPETREVTSTAELRDELPSICAASADRGWSIKAPFGAAGRERVHRWGADIPDDIAIRIGRLIDRYSCAIAEPWMPRELDFGVAGLVGKRGLTLFPPHRLLADGGGVARGIEIDDRVPWLRSGERGELEHAAAACGEALAAAGYVGPFGIDGFVYSDPEGRRRLHRVCEINARMTFGLVARAHWERRGNPAQLEIAL